MNYTDIYSLLHILAIRHFFRCAIRISFFFLVGTCANMLRYVAQTYSKWKSIQNRRYEAWRKYRRFNLFQGQTLQNLILFHGLLWIDTAILDWTSLFPLKTILIAKMTSRDVWLWHDANMTRMISKRQHWKKFLPWLDLLLLIEDILNENFSLFGTSAKLSCRNDCRIRKYGGIKNVFFWKSFRNGL